MKTTCCQCAPKYILASLVVAVCSFVEIGDAHAYPAGSLTVHYAEVDTSNCERLSGDLKVISHSDSCELPDSVDGTFFDKDSGGVAVKVVLSNSNGMVAKIEFHPFGEHLWVYDTRNDGDSIYVQLYANGNFISTYGVTGTDSTVDYNVYDLSFTEGTVIEFDITDDAAGVDFITNAFGNA